MNLSLVPTLKNLAVCAVVHAMGSFAYANTTNIEVPPIAMPPDTEILASANLESKTQESTTTDTKTKADHTQEPAILTPPEESVDTSTFLAPDTQRGFDTQIWIAGSVLLVLALIGGTLVKFKSKNETFKRQKHIQLISALSLSPRRQVFLIKIRDQEFALSSTESGIQILSEIKTQELPVPAAPSRVQSKTEPLNLNSSDNFMTKTLNRLKKQELPQQDIKVPSKYQDADRQAPDLNPKTSATLPKGFPKYLINTFEQESRNQILDEDNVTNMIKSKLKDLRPMA